MRRRSKRRKDNMTDVELWAWMQEQAVIPGWNHKKLGDCWLWPRSRDEWGYGRLGYKEKLESAHRLAWLFTHGSLPEKPLQINHLCRLRPHCFNPAHLYVGTSKENASDRKRDRTEYNKRGENNPKVVLTDKLVIKLRQLRKQGATWRELTELSGICRSATRSAVATGKDRTWTHLDSIESPAGE